jgi:DNA-binding beta-propeller fold protein YncE
MKSVKLRLALVLSALLGALSVKAAGEGEAASVPPALYLKPLALVTQLLYEGDLAEPRGVAVDRVRGEVWVADARAGVVALFTPEGVPVFASRGDGHLKEPSRVAVGPDGRLYVLDNDRSKVKILSYRGEFLGMLDLPGLPAAPVFGAVAFDAEGNLFVGENSGCQVHVFTREFKRRTAFGSCGAGEGEFQSIAGIAVDRERIYVVDHQVLAVQVFDRRGNFLKGWGKHDMGVQNVSLPEDIALDSKGRIVVIDALRHEIKFFDQDGVFLGRFGGLGSRAGQIAFPSGVAIGADDRLYVVEKGNGRLQVLTETDTPPPVRATP